jgi:signal transduction histidine kinase
MIYSPIPHLPTLGGSLDSNEATLVVSLAGSETAWNAPQIAPMTESYRQHDQVLAMLGHELRNPLAVIAGAADVIELTQGDQIAQLEAIRLLKRQVPELLRMVDGLIDVSRLLMGHLRLVQRWTDLREIALRASAEVMARVAARSQTLEHSLPPAPVAAFVDDQRLCQALVQLLDNASKFSEAGGTVRLELSGEPAAATIRVRDEGIGIGAELLPHVFEPFVQGAQTLERARGGVGIGLTLARELTRLHGGELSVASEGERRGSEFMMKLPRTEPQG